MIEESLSIGANLQNNKPMTVSIIEVFAKHVTVKKTVQWYNARIILKYQCKEI